MIYIDKSMAERKRRSQKTTQSKKKAETSENLNKSNTSQKKSSLKFRTPTFWQSFLAKSNQSHTLEGAKVTTWPKAPTFWGVIGILLVMLVVYSIGRMQTNCALVYSSNIGTLKYMEVMVPKNNTFSITSFLPVRAYNQSDLTSEKRLILVSPQGQALQVVYNTSANLSQYDGKNVILTGQLSPCTQTISLDTLQNITPLI